MKKKWKISLSVVVALLLAISTYLIYIFKFKEYDVADEEVSKIVSAPYEVELPDGSKLVFHEEDDSAKGEDETESHNDKSIVTIDKPDSVKAATLATPNQSSSKSNSSTSSLIKQNGSTSNKSEESAPKQTVAEVKAKYEPVFQQLEGQADSKISSLIGRAKNEYTTKKANGESVNYGYFYNKYMGAAESLEASTDTAFYGVVKSLKNELAANGYSASHADSFIDHYEAMKKSRRDSLIKKAVRQ